MRESCADIRTAFAAERTYYTDTLTYTTDPVEMDAIESALAAGAVGFTELTIVDGQNRWCWKA